MQRHSGTLPARRYGPRAKKSQAAAAAGGSAPHFAGGNPSTSRETVVRSNLKSADDDSASSLDHRSNQEPGASQLSSHDVVHLAKQHQQVLDANQHLLNQHRTAAASSAAAQMGMQFSPRFYPPSSTITAPLAHTASWLAAAGAGIAGPKGRMAAPPYDSFSLTSYAGFQHPSHLEDFPFSMLHHHTMWTIQVIMKSKSLLHITNHHRLEVLLPRLGQLQVLQIRQTNHHTRATNTVHNKLNQILIFHSCLISRKNLSGTRVETSMKKCPEQRDELQVSLLIIPCL